MESGDYASGDPDSWIYSVSGYRTWGTQTVPVLSSGNWESLHGRLMAPWFHS